MDGQSDPDDAEPAAWWNEVYAGETAPAWDTGKPQPALVDAVQRTGLRGSVLDVGCGTGTHALWASERGHTAVGVDFSETGIQRARARAGRRELDATFRVANALDPPDDLGTFETVLDSGLFHAFETVQREPYARELADVVSVGGCVFIVGFGDGAPEDWGPNPFDGEAVRSAFGDAWTVLETQDAVFETRETSVPGCTAVVERVEA